VKRDTQRKAVEILQAIDKIIQEHAEEYEHGKIRGPVIGLSPDWGPFSWTIEVGNSHTHAGSMEENFEDFVSSLHDTLCRDRGMSWHTEGEEK
jgi:hypothetical protein